MVDIQPDPEHRPGRLKRSRDAVWQHGSRLRQRFTPQTLRAPSLDWLNFFVADVRGGLGPFVIVYLVTQRGWSPTDVGLVTTLGGWIGLVAQTPIGAWLDRTNRKRGALLCALVVLSLGATVIALAPSFWPVMLANGAMQLVSGVFDPAIAALTVGLIGRDLLTARMGRNAAWSRAGNIAVAVSSAAVAWLISAEAVFLQVPIIALLTAIAAMTIPYGKVDLRRARGLESGEGRNEGPSAWLTLLQSRPLIVFGICSFLYELADAPLLTLVGQKLGAENKGAGIMLTSGLIIAAQAGMLAASILVGKRADTLGHRWLLAVGFAMLPVQGVLTAVLNGPAALTALQVFGGVSSGIFAALTPIWLADATRGSGHYNLSQGLMATLRSLGVTTSGLLSEVVVDYLGYPAAFLGCAAVGAISAVLLWFALPEKRFASGAVQHA